MRRPRRFRFNSHSKLFLTVSYLPMKTLTLSLAAAVLTFLSGCAGGSDGRVPVYKVAGKVTMTGAPLSGAIVTFAPKDGQPVAIGRTDSSGEYTLTTYDPGDGAATGAYSVTVAKFAAVAAAAPAEAAHSTDPYAEANSMHGGGKANGADEGGNLIPPQYSDPQKTPLSFVVKADGDNRFDIDVK